MKYKIFSPKEEKLSLMLLRTAELDKQTKAVAY